MHGKSYQIPKKYYLGSKYPEIYFTERETRCLECCVAGMTQQEIAETLNLSEQTIGFYLKNMKMKLSCTTEQQLIEKSLNSDLRFILNKKVILNEYLF